MSETSRIELTFRLWSTGANDHFEEYVGALTSLLPRHHGELVRRVEPIDATVGAPDAHLVMGFPNATAVDGFLHDPARADLEELAARAVVRAVISDGRSREAPSNPATLHTLPHDDEPDSG